MRIVIAGGGTGGHLFPGIAMAQEFMKRDPDNRVLFVSTGNPFEVSVLEKAGFPLRRVSSSGIKGRKRWQQALAALKIPIGVAESLWILWRFGADLVVGVGGYSSGPVVAGAWMLRRKIVLHEQNIVPGITNRLLSYLAHRVHVSFPKTADYFKQEKVWVSGNPVRREIAEITDTRVGARKPFTVLIIGGSQGAHRINLAVAEALEHLVEKKRFYFLHQTGPKDEDTVQAAYQKQGVAATVQPFFHDMGSKFQETDLIVCRAGATTVAEITALGKPAILIPFPYAADDHQRLNAEDLESAGAAEMILEKDLDGRLLARRVGFYADQPDRLDRMAAAAKTYGKPDAAARIVDDCYALLAEG